ncbi:hypothetical protein HD806DRAFT_419156 [Xylariaceae sp. AK1471]|nr:hypothetical protein HD806DRAFT_419156 [Xylariaceae sp. AK1471]
MTTEGICLSKLSRNFQDAITITRGLHLRYLWIDALCIMQDFEGDWVGEVAKMAQYYCSSEVTISALAAPNVQYGILLPRLVLGCPPSIDIEAGTLYLRRPLPNSTTVRSLDSCFAGREPVANLPLNKRAWTLKERLFSRRILYFTEDQIIWQCRKRFFAEDGQYNQQTEGYPEKLSSVIVDILNPQPRLLGQEKIAAPPSILSTGWYALVNEYTKRKLSYTKDLLPAISGLAREIHHLTNRRYAAGLWFGNTGVSITCLMWTLVRHRHEYTPPKPSPSWNGSPSWSWTSLVAEVEFPFVVYTNDWEDQDTNFAKQHFLLLECLPWQSTIFKRAGLSSTEAGTLFPINMENGWTRRKISIV